MTTRFIKYCPVCGTTDIDTSSHGSDGHAQCRRCHSRFSVDAVIIDDKQKKDKVSENNED